MLICKKSLVFLCCWLCVRSSILFSSGGRASEPADWIKEKGTCACDTLNPGCLSPRMKHPPPNGWSPPPSTRGENQVRTAHTQTAHFDRLGDRTTKTAEWLCCSAHSTRPKNLSDFHWLCPWNPKELVFSPSVCFTPREAVSQGGPKESSARRCGRHRTQTRFWVKDSKGYRHWAGVCWEPLTPESRTISSGDNNGRSFHSGRRR